MAVLKIINIYVLSKAGKTSFTVLYNAHINEHNVYVLKPSTQITFSKYINNRNWRFIQTIYNNIYIVKGRYTIPPLQFCNESNLPKEDKLTNYKLAKTIFPNINNTVSLVVVQPVKT